MSKRIEPVDPEVLAELERLRAEDAAYEREHPGWTWISKWWLAVIAVVIALGLFIDILVQFIINAD